MTNHVFLSSRTSLAGPLVVMISLSTLWATCLISGIIFRSAFLPTSSGTVYTKEMSSSRITMFASGGSCSRHKRRRSYLRARCVRVAIRIRHDLSKERRHLYLLLLLIIDVERPVRTKSKRCITGAQGANVREVTRQTLHQNRVQRKCLDGFLG